MTKPVIYILVLASLIVFPSFIISSNDSNNDGKPDEWLEEDDSRRLWLTADTNFDGSVDYRVRLDTEGDKEYEELDYNHDGMMDDYYFYEKGILVRQEVDTNYDSSVDLWVYIHKGIYIKMYEKDTDFDGIPDVVKNFDK